MDALDNDLVGQTAAREDSGDGELLRVNRRSARRRAARGRSPPSPRPGRRGRDAGRSTPRASSRASSASATSRGTAPRVRRGRTSPRCPPPPGPNGRSSRSALREARRAAADIGDFQRAHRGRRERQAHVKLEAMRRRGGGRRRTPSGGHFRHRPSPPSRRPGQRGAFGGCVGELTRCSPPGSPTRTRTAPRGRPAPATAPSLVVHSRVLPRAGLREDKRPRGARRGGGAVRRPHFRGRDAHLRARCSRGDDAQTDDASSPGHDRKDTLTC